MFFDRYGGVLMKNKFRKVVILAGMLVMMAATSISAYAAENRNDGFWKHNQTGWWYEFVDGSYLTNGWYWIDGNHDGVYECYYFDGNGYMASNTSIGSDAVDANGAWVVNGVVQTKRVETVEKNDSKEEVHFVAYESKENNKNESSNLPGYGLTTEDIMNTVDWSTGTSTFGGGEWHWH